VRVLVRHVLSRFAMTTYKTFLALALFAVPVTGCLDEDARPAPGQPVLLSDGTTAGPVDASFHKFVRSQNLALHIEPDGAVTRQRVDGLPETLQLDAAMVDDLHAKIIGAKFSTLEPKYGCGGCADHPDYQIAVVLGDSAFVVQADTSARFPEGLSALIDKLEEISALPAE
jgi:hypothetical protein